MLDFIELYVPGEILIGLFILGLIVIVLLCVCIYLIVKYELVDAIDMIIELMRPW